MNEFYQTKTLFSKVEANETKTSKQELLRLFSHTDEKAPKQEPRQLFSHTDEEKIKELVKMPEARSHEISEKEKKVQHTEARDISRESACERALICEIPRVFENQIQANNQPVNGQPHIRQYPPQYAPDVIAQPKAKQTNSIGEDAEFMYQNGKLIAFGNSNSLYLGNFCLQILQEKITVEEIVNQANEVVGDRKCIFWLIKIVTQEKAFEGWVESEKLFRLNWIREISRERAISDEKADVKRLLHMYINKLIKTELHPVVTEYKSSGWKWLEDGTVCYLTSSGAVGLEHLSIKAVSGFDLLTIHQSSAQNFCEFIGMREIIPQNKGNAVMLQYYLIDALMTALFKKSGHQIEFCMALIGKTNTKKTSCGEIFTRVFNRTRSAVPEINFSATEAAIFEIMDKCADTIVMIDDLTPSQNDLIAREKNRKLEDIIRTYGDRVPRRRSVTYASNKSAKEFIPPNGCGLITGEEFSGGKSSRSRIIQLKFEEGDVDNANLAFYQERLYTLPNFAYDFLKYVTNRVEHIIEIIKYECASARQRGTGTIKLPRYVDAFGVFCAGTRIFYEYILCNQLMDAESAKKMIEDDRQLILQVLQDNDRELCTISPGVTILEALKESLEKGGLKSQLLSNVRSDEDFGRLCMEDENFYYISSEKLWECARAYTNHRGLYFPYTVGREIINPLRADDLILVKKEGNAIRSSHKLVINGKVINQRFLYLYKDKVKKIWEELERY